MKKHWWIALSIILFLINVFLLIEMKNLKKEPFQGKISIEGLDGETTLPLKDSFLTIIIYFSERSCEVCLEESYYWNKLGKDLSKDEIFIVGFIPEKEDAEKIKNKNEIIFPILKDKEGKIAKKFHISLTPFKIILDRWGNIIYMSPSFSGKESQESFYFEVLELLRKIRVKESMLKGLS